MLYVYSVSIVCLKVRLGTRMFGIEKRYRIKRTNWTESASESLSDGLVFGFVEFDGKFISLLFNLGETFL